MIANHVIINNDLQKADKELERFLLDYLITPENLKEVIRNITPLIVGVHNQQASIQAYVTILVRWECTEADYKSYLFRMQTLIKKA